MPRDYKVYLDDIREAIQKINLFTKGFSKYALQQDPKTLDAVVRNLEIIGEAVKNIPDSIRAKYYATGWKKIAGLRDILVHEYFGIDMDIIWDIIQNKLPVLQKQIDEIK
jgi:uncharacterized protein with HEPN domain